VPFSSMVPVSCVCSLCLPRSGTETSVRSVPWCFCAITLPVLSRCVSFVTVSVLPAVTPRKAMPSDVVVVVPVVRDSTS